PGPSQRFCLTAAWRRLMNREARGVFMAQSAYLLLVMLGAGLADPALAGQEKLQWEVPADLAATTPVRRVFLEVRLAETEPVRGLTFEAPVKGSEKKVHIHYAT